MTQEERVLDNLVDGEWHCGTEFLSNYLYVYSQRVSNINAREPGRIASRVCRAHEHRGAIREYSDTTIDREPRQLVLV